MIDWQPEPICMMCSKEITDDKVQDITGEPVCSWECQWKLEDESVAWLV